MKPLVVIADFLTEPLDHERRILGDLAEIVALDAHGEEELVGRIEQADVVLLYHELALTARTIDRLQCCKLIVRCGVGYDNVDVAAAQRRGIAVANVPDYGTEEVADSAIGMTLALVRGISLLNSRLRVDGGRWSYTHAAPIRRLRGRVFGIVGIGRIGTATALRAKALGMDVVYYDPYVPDGRDKSLGVRRCEQLDELLAQADVVSIHCPHTPETRNLFHRETLAKMRRGSFLVNTARGHITDPLAVLEAITSGHLAGAALDVLPVEPPPADHPLLVAWRDPSHPAHDRLILNPHSAFYSEEGRTDMRIKGVENARRVLLGQPPRNVVG